MAERLPGDQNRRRGDDAAANRHPGHAAKHGARDCKEGKRPAIGNGATRQSMRGEGGAGGQSSDETAAQSRR